MHGYKLSLAAAAALLVLATGGCRYERHMGDDHSKAGVGAIKDAINADEAKWNDEFQAKPWNIDALTAHYAPDAYFALGGSKVSGAADIRKAYEEFAGDPNAEVTFASDKVDVAASGDMAYSRGHLSQKYTDPKTKKVVSEAGSFLTVYKKQDDGSWKAVEDFVASAPTG